MRRWAVPCLDAGQRKLADEMGSAWCVGRPFLLQMAFLMWSWKRVRQTETQRGLIQCSELTWRNSIKGQKSYFNFLEVGPVPVLHSRAVSCTCPPPNRSFSSGTGPCDDTLKLFIFSGFFVIVSGTFSFWFVKPKFRKTSSKTEHVFTDHFWISHVLVCLHRCRLMKITFYVL